jgi:hypothetical protein
VVLASAPVSSEKPEITVGPNVHVSKAKDTVHHTESVIAAHPAKAASLFIASMHGPGVVGYYSEDGGKSWQPSFERKQDPDKGGRTEFIFDPAAAFGPGGSLHFVCARYWFADKPPQPKFGDPDVGRLEFIRSGDGGKTWGPPKTIPTFTDRPWLAVDCTEGKYRGRLYCFATIDKPVLHVSQDEGRTFAKPLTWRVKAGLFPRPVNPVVLSDGTLVLLYGLDPQNYAVDPADTRGHVQILALFSHDGGGSLEAGTPVSTYWGDTGNFRFPQLAVDARAGKHQDRLYAVWTDGALLNRAQRTQARIIFSSSKDKGRSWSKPQVLSEQPTSTTKGKDYAAFLPSVAVNRNGVVAVSWYDRRGMDDPAEPGLPAGWNVRVRISSDGGETWQPSVRVNEKTGKGRANELRETAGLAADAGGNFHPVWIDDRTGKRQVWTAAVKVGPK